VTTPEFPSALPEECDANECGGFQDVLGTMLRTHIGISVCALSSIPHSGAGITSLYVAVHPEFVGALNQTNMVIATITGKQLTR
jgi:hypothetical protein